MTTPPGPTPGERRVPDRRAGLGPVRAPVRIIGTAAGAAGISLVALLYLVGAPIVAMVTGLTQIVLDIRDNAVRPRPFVGARHGLPFLDPVRPRSPESDTTEED